MRPSNLTIFVIFSFLFAVKTVPLPMKSNDLVPWLSDSQKAQPVAVTLFFSSL